MTQSILAIVIAGSERYFFLDYRQKNPLKYYILPLIAVYGFMVHSRKVGKDISNSRVSFRLLSASGG
jgi:hypothetical protein